MSKDSNYLAELAERINKRDPLESACMAAYLELKETLDSPADFFQEEHYRTPQNRKYTDVRSLHLHNEDDYILIERKIMDYYRVRPEEILAIFDYRHNKMLITTTGISAHEHIRPLAFATDARDRLQKQYKLTFHNNRPIVFPT